MFDGSCRSGQNRHIPVCSRDRAGTTRSPHFHRNFLENPQHGLACAGAGGLGVVATWFLPNSLEDLLALALAGAVGYASILNLPLRRREAKDRLEAVSSKFTQVRPLFVGTNQALTGLADGTVFTVLLSRSKHVCIARCATPLRHLRLNATTCITAFRDRAQRLRVPIPAMMARLEP